MYETYESAAGRRWRLVKLFFFGDGPVLPAAHYLKRLKHKRARERWSFVRRTLLPEKPLKTKEMRMDWMSDGVEQRRELDFAEIKRASLKGIKTCCVDAEVARITREPSITAADSPYKTALTMLEDLGWELCDRGRKSPRMPTMPQLSTVRYHPNHEAFFDEATGYPIAKFSTRNSKMTPASFFGQSCLSDVHEGVSRKPSVHDFYARKRKFPSFRLKNLRFTVTQTVSRYLRACTRPDVQV